MDEFSNIYANGTYAELRAYYERKLEERYLEGFNVGREEVLDKVAAAIGVNRGKN